MRQTLLILLALTTIAVSTCTPEASEPAIDLEAETEAVNEISLSWLTHARAKDAAAIAGLFMNDGVLFGENHEPIVGPTAIEAHLTKNIEENPDQDPNFGSDRIVVSASGDLAVEFGTWGPEGPEGDYGKYITVYRKVDGVWKVAGDMALSTKPEADASSN